MKTCSHPNNLEKKQCAFCCPLENGQCSACSYSTKWTNKCNLSDNIKATFDGETGKLKKVEMI